MSASRRRPPRLHVVDADGDDAGGDGRPVVKIVAGRRSEAIDKAEEVLVDRANGLYQRGEFIVRVAPQDISIEGREVSALRIVRVGTQHMREYATRHVDLQRFDKRSGKFVSCDCPTDFAEAYLERIGLWRVPALRAVTTTPTLRRDGSIIDCPGYDQATGIFYDPCGVVFPPVERAPSRQAALDAVDRLETLFGTLDFIDGAARSVALSAIQTAVCRHALAAAPLHAVSAPVRGAGKSKVVNVAAILATGHPAPALAVGKQEEETEKRIGAVLQAGDPVVNFDNIEHQFGGELLCQVVTEPLVNVRILGTSSMLMVPNVTLWCATGNNLRFVGDMSRRVLICRLDPHCERPELREFETPDPVIVALQERPALVTAALTIARAFLIAGCPRREPPIGSFPDWSKWVRDALIWLDRDDPAATMAAVHGDEPRRVALTAVLEQWAKVIRGERVSAREVAAKAGAIGNTGHLHPELREALMAVAEGSGGNISVVRLGKWLGQIKDRVVAGRRIEAARIVAGVAQWRLVETG